MALTKKNWSELASFDAHARTSERDCAGLVEQLADPRPSARRWAARDLADCPQCTTALLDRLQIEVDSSVREIIFTTLIRCSSAEVALGLVEFLRSEDAAVRNETIEALKQMPKSVSAMMQSLLRDPDSDVRIFAVNILESLRHPEVEYWLVDVIVQDPQVNVCATAVDLLGEVGSRDALQSLMDLKARFEGEPYIQFAADLAIRRISEN